MSPFARRRRDAALPRDSRVCTLSLTRSPAIPVGKCSEGILGLLPERRRCIQGYPGGNSGAAPDVPEPPSWSAPSVNLDAKGEAMQSKVEALRKTVAVGCMTIALLCAACSEGGQATDADTGTVPTASAATTTEPPPLSAEEQA